MPKIYLLGRFAGLRVSARPSAFVAFLILWLLLSGAGYWLLGFQIWIALAGGFAASLLHFASELWHQVSHSLMARKTGYPMAGVVLWWFLGTSRYPSQEGELPAHIHIRRALGGPAGSLGIAIGLALLALFLRPAGTLIWWLVIFASFDNLLVFTLGSLLPLGFTDGSTILYWKGRGNRE